MKFRRITVDKEKLIHDLELKKLDYPVPGSFYLKLFYSREINNKRNNKKTIYRMFHERTKCTIFSVDFLK